MRVRLSACVTLDEGENTSVKFTVRKIQRGSYEVNFTGFPPSDPSGITRLSKSFKLVPMELGDWITLDETKVSVREFVEVSEIKWNGNQLRPHAGAGFVLVHVTSKNVGKTKVKLPSSLHISLDHFGKVVNEVSLTQPVPDNFLADGDKYPMYDPPIESFPGHGADGWLPYELPSEFEPENVIVEVGIPEEDLVVSWRLS